MKHKALFKRLASAVLAVTLCTGIVSNSMINMPAAAIDADDFGSDFWSDNFPFIPSDFNPEPLGEKDKHYEELGELYFSVVEKLNDKGFETASKVLNVAGSAFSVALSGLEIVETIHSFLLITGAIDEPTEEGFRTVERSLDHISAQLDEMQGTMTRMDESLKQLYSQAAINDRFATADRDLKAWTDFENAYIKELEELSDEYKLRINRSIKNWYESNPDGKDEITVYYRLATQKDVTDNIKVGDLISTIAFIPNTDDAVIMDIYGNEIASKYTFTIPKEYIAEAFTNHAAYNIDKLNDNMRLYIASAIKKAANDKKLIADESFFTEWEKLTDEQKTAKASALANDALETLIYNITSDFVNNTDDIEFISKVHSYVNLFCEALQKGASENPAVRYLNYLYSNYGFEKEARSAVEKFNLSLSGKLVKYSLMAYSIVGSSNLVSSVEKENMKKTIASASRTLKSLSDKSLKNNSDYCYVTQSNIKYNNYRAEMESSLSFKDKSNALKDKLKYEGMNTISVTQDEERKFASDVDLALLNIMYKKYVARYNAQQEILNDPDYKAGTIPEDEILKSLDTFADYLKEYNVAGSDTDVRDNLVYNISSAQSYDPNMGLRLYDAISKCVFWDERTYILCHMASYNSSLDWKFGDGNIKDSNYNNDYYTAANVKDEKRITADLYNVSDGTYESDKTVLAMQIGENHSKNWFVDEMNLQVCGDDYYPSVSQNSDKITTYAVTAIYDYGYIYEYDAESNSLLSNDFEDIIADPFETYEVNYAVIDPEKPIPEAVKWDYDKWNEYGKTIDNLDEYDLTHEKIVKSINAHIDSAMEKANITLSDDERKEIFDRMLDKYAEIEKELFNSDSLRVTDTLGIYGDEEKTIALIDEFLNDSSIPAENAMTFNIYYPYLSLELSEKDGKTEYDITTYYNIEPCLFVKDSYSDHVSFFEIPDGILERHSLSVDVYLPLPDNGSARRCLIKQYDDEEFPVASSTYEADVASNGDERYAKITVTHCSPFTIEALTSENVPTGESGEKYMLSFVLLATAGIAMAIAASRKSKA